MLNDFLTIIYMKNALITRQRQIEETFSRIILQELYTSITIYINLYANNVSLSFAKKRIKF